MKEIWKFFKDTRRYRKDGTVYTGGIWEVSSYGNVKKDGVLYECGKLGAYKAFSKYFVHRIVAELFIPNPENKPFVDHIDTNPLNNHISNLQWCTASENMNNPITKKRLSESMKKRHISEESIEKQRQSIKKYYQTHTIWNKGLKMKKEDHPLYGKKRIWDNEEHTKWHWEKVI